MIFSSRSSYKFEVGGGDGGSGGGEAFLSDGGSGGGSIILSSWFFFDLCCFFLRFRDFPRRQKKILNKFYFDNILPS